MKVLCKLNSAKYPAIFHLGLPKTGTTTIKHILRQDKRINLIENRYFNTPDYWLKEYDFIDSDNNNLISVCSEENQLLQSGNFGKIELTLSRIRKVSPDAKIILTIREQRDMLESRYKFCIPYFEGHYFEFDDWLKSGQGMDYLSISMYHVIFKTLATFFPKENIHFLLFEDLKDNPFSFFHDFYKIIGLSLPVDIDFNVKKNIALTEPELKIIKSLNKYKLFRKDSKIARREATLFKKLGSLYQDMGKKIEEFRWGSSGFHKKIEKDFALENLELLKENVVSGDNLKKYNYLLP